MRGTKSGAVQNHCALLTGITLDFGTSGLRNSEDAEPRDFGTPGTSRPRLFFVYVRIPIAPLIVELNL